MKGRWLFCTALALAIPLLAGAAQWTIDSSPFDFPNTGVRFNRAAVSSHATLAYKPGVSRGVVTFLYSLPASARAAQLSVYSLSGVLLDRFSLTPAASAVQWNVSKRSVGSGVYLAVMRCGALENKIQLSIVK